MRKKFGFRFWIGKLHLWLGLLSGIVVFIVAITGCIFVFHDDIKDALHDYRAVEIENKPFLAPSRISAIGQQVYPVATISRLVMFDEGRSAWVLLKEKNDFFYVYINPYSGKVLYHQNIKDDFFMTVQYLHMYLLLPKEIGKPIVGYSVLIFVVMLITGLILWWPKRRSHRKQRLTIKWNSRWRRLNYDLHNVLGFYVFAIALVLAITGLSMSFEWVKNGLRNTTNLGKVYPLEKAAPPVSDTTAVVMNEWPALDVAFTTVQNAAPKSSMFLLFPPSKNTATIHIVAYEKQLHYYKRNNYHFDQYSGALLKQVTHSEKSAGLQLNEMNYDLHTGIIFGMTGKIVAFITSLIIASLPVTGVILWLGRRKRKGRNT